MTVPDLGAEIVPQERPTLCFLTPTRRPGWGDPLGVIRSEYEELAVAFRELGFNTVIADAEDPGFLRTVLTVGQGPANVLYGHFFYDMLVVATAMPPYAVWDVLPATIAPYVADHPIAPFMRQRIQNLPGGRVVFVFEPDFIDQIRLLSPDVGRFCHLPGLVFGVGHDDPLPFRKRAFDVVVAFRDKKPAPPPVLDEVLTDPVFGEALAATEEILLEDFSQPLFGTFVQNVMATSGVDVSDMIRQDRGRVEKAFEALHYLDFFVRNERRRRLLQQVLAETGDLKVCFVGNPPEAFGVKVDEKVSYVLSPELSFFDLMRLYRNSRFVIHSQPTYPGALHERFLNAAACGAVVITEAVPAYCEHFVEGQEWLAARYDMTLTDLTSRTSNDFEEMGMRARRTAWRKFSALAHARRILNALNCEAVGGGESELLRPAGD